MPGPENQPKTLIFRLSSLGDIVLSTAALGALAGLRRKSDWVTASEYGQLLEGHPVIDQLILYDRRSTGLVAWIKLCAALAASDYDEVLDLHRNLRTRIARLVFLFCGAHARWTLVDKQRLRNIGYFLFKSRWPKGWRPDPVVELFSQVAEQSEQGHDDEDSRHVPPQHGRPELQHMVRDALSVRNSLGEEFEKGYLCVMPSAQWFGKRWPAGFYAEALQGIALPIVVMGGKSDVASLELAELLQKQGHVVCSGVGRWSLREAAKVLAQATAYLGNDTGLAHLAEAVGKPAVIVYGPTSPHAGFGPWRPESRTARTDLWCGPCGKIGRICFRPIKRYECHNHLTPEEVRRQTESAIAPAEPAAPSGEAR